MNIDIEIKIMGQFHQHTFHSGIYDNRHIRLAEEIIRVPGRSCERTKDVMTEESLYYWPVLAGSAIYVQSF